MKDLMKIVTALYPGRIPHKLSLLLHEVVSREEYKKKSLLVKPGEIGNRLYCNEKGMLRCYTRHNNRDLCSWFMLEGDFAIAVVSFFEQEPSVETIEALEDCTVLSITYEDLERIYQLFPLYRKVGQYLTEKYYCQTRKIETQLRMKTPEEFYDYLLEEHNGLVMRVPNKHLASFMGITEPTLYKIKKKKNS